MSTAVDIHQAGAAVSDPQDALAAAWYHLAGECAKAVSGHHHLIDQLSRAGLLPPPTATALTASTDQIEAMAAKLRRRHHTNPG